MTKFIRDDIEILSKTKSIIGNLIYTAMTDIKNSLGFDPYDISKEASISTLQPTGAGICECDYDLKVAFYCAASLQKGDYIFKIRISRMHTTGFSSDRVLLSCIEVTSASFPGHRIVEVIANKVTEKLRESVNKKVLDQGFARILIDNLEMNGEEN